MFEVIGPWAADNAGHGVIVLFIGIMYRDLRNHMRDEKRWREGFEDWRVDHLTDHP